MARYGYGREDEGWGYYEPRGRGRGDPWRSEGERWEPEERWERERRGEEWRGGMRERDRWREEDERRWHAENPGETWRGGAPTAEAGMPFGRSHFGRAYALYSGGGREGRFEGAGDPRRGAEGGRWEGRGMEERRGRPPRAYRRSDQAILDEIAERIVFGGIDAGEVEVKVENGEVTLTGTVADRRDKRRIEDACEEVLGVEDVHNQIRVSRREAEARDVH